MEALAKIILAARAACGVENMPADSVLEFVATSVQGHMAGFDASHDFNHVIRVVALAKSIMVAERDSKPTIDPAVVLLAALLHDVTDKKYTQDSDGDSKLTQILEKAGVHGPLATAIVTVVNNVSYSTEMRHPNRISSVLSMHPELGIVQDADRLDAIGAIGIGRAFTYGGAQMPLSDMQLSRNHMTEKLAKLEYMMKTETGRNLARQRMQRIHMFTEWWDGELRILDGDATE
ncbi:hypothetical protein MY11210_004221 [Beauveria gryllotalpidicola]